MRRYLTEVLIERKLAVIKEIAAEDMWDHTQPKPGREGLERHAGGFLAAIPDVQIVIDHIIADEDKVVGVWIWRGTPVVQFFGVPPTGREVECRVASVFKLRDGLLVDYWVIADGLATVRQMGAEVVIPSA
jgi:predicted ester cyclase